ncbi:MAG: hypothetical protein DAHOPDDO_00614 [Ignavibacteriaceae bacterium]|nr:hypothetical protein [Ignavibacteriaceae bacterium]
MKKLLLLISFAFILLSCSKEPAESGVDFRREILGEWENATKDTAIKFYADGDFSVKGITYPSQDFLYNDRYYEYRFTQDSLIRCNYGDADYTDYFIIKINSLHEQEMNITLKKYIYRVDMNLKKVIEQEN